MKLKVGTQWHVLAVVIALVVVGLRSRTIMEHQAWSDGSATVQGRVEDIQASRQVRVIRYSYNVHGQEYRDEITDKTAFSEGFPVTVTYAKKDPSISTLQPEKIGSIYVTSLIVAAVGLLPLLIVWFYEIKLRLRKEPAVVAEA
jgi:hypothetical protein